MFIVRMERKDRGSKVVSDVTDSLVGVWPLSLNISPGLFSLCSLRTGSLL